MDKNQVWAAVLQRISEKISRMEFCTWFKKVHLTEISGAAILISCPTEMNKNWMETKYHSLLLSNLKGVLPEIEKIFFDVKLELQNAPTQTPDLFQAKKAVRKLPNKPEVRLSPGIESRIIHSKFTLQNFVVGEENRFAHSACLAAAEQKLNEAKKYNPLFVYGGVGLGKTHLLQGAANEILRRHPEAKVVYTTAERFMNEIIKAIRERKTDMLRKKYRQVDALIIDDIQFFEGKEKTQEELFNTFNDLHEFHKQIIFSADRPPSDLVGISDRLRSRMGWGLSADVQMPGYETRLAIIQEKANEMNLMLPPDVQEFLATNTRKNLRELESWLNQISAEIEISKISPTIQSVGKIWRKLNPHEDLTLSENGKPGLVKNTDDIITFVSEYFQIPATELLGTSRKSEIVLPRQVSWFLCKEVLKMSFEKIGKDFSKNHTTILHGIKKVQELTRTDSAMARHLHALRKDLGVK
ncbi:chromosomal replication initiator protein DnaA [Candidatus Gracilibacteria bacterium]|nr:chromosomal replication initiator protein DnaA [Candidatus Gracilibacteria bacterium]